VLGLLCAISGLGITVFKESFPAWLQWNLIGHSLVGAFTALPFAWYSVVHFRRTVGIRKASVLFSGLIATSIFIIVFLSGFHLTVMGQPRKRVYYGD